MSERFSICRHESFSVKARVGRLTDTDGGPVTGYTADIKVECDECHLPFHWVGVPLGLSPNRPMVSADGLELRAPIAPGEGGFFT